MRSIIVGLALISVISCCVQKKEGKTVKQNVKEAPVMSETPIQVILMENPRFNNKKVIVTGKAFREENMAPDAMFIIQYMASHLGESEEHESDGHGSGNRELRLKVKYGGAAGIPFNSWIRVQGTVRGEMQDMVLEAESLSVIPKPVHPDLHEDE